MKEIKLFDYQQEMLENITEVFSAAAFDTVLYNEKGKRVNVGSSVMEQMQQTLDRFCLAYSEKEEELKAKVESSIQRATMVVMPS